MVRLHRAYGLLSSALAVVLLGTPTAVRAQEGPAGTPAPDADERLSTYRLQLDWHPIGYVVPEKELRFTNFIRMHPSGFRADKYALYFAPTYGLGNGWEVTAGVTGAERIGEGGEALFYGAGIQKQFVSETRTRPAVSVGAYGMAGPHDHHNGTLYLAATKQVWQHGERTVFVHGGVKLEGYDSDDYGSGTGVRPYIGATLGLSQRFSVSGEFSPSQPWERSNMYAARASYRVYKRLGISGGVRNNGYRTEPFVGVTF